MIFGILPGPLEVIVITIILIACIIKVVTSVEQAAKSNGLNVRQKVTYGSLWLLAAVLLAGCAFAACKSSEASLPALFYTTIIVFVVCMSGFELSDNWSLSHED